MRKRLRRRHIYVKHHGTSWMALVDRLRDDLAEPQQHLSALPPLPLC